MAQPRKPASQRIPVIAQPFVGEKAKKFLDTIEKWVDEECIPADAVYSAQMGIGDERWNGHPAILDDLKKRARELGLWNMFLPKAHFKEGAGFSNLEYGLMAEYLGKSRTASEVCCHLNGLFSNIFGIGHWLILCRLPTVLLQIRETWKSLPSTAMSNRNANG